MVILKFMGGLGNQLFQYAFYRSMESHGKDMKADLSFYNNKNLERPWSLQIFPNIRVSVADRKDLRKISKTRSWIDRFKKEKMIVIETEEEYGTYAERFYQEDNSILEGYFQNIRYFEDIENELRKELQFPKPEEKLQQLIDRIEGSGNYVSVHVRRGDYLKYADIYGGICTREYYQKAIQKVNTFVKDYKLCILSDDAEWVQDNFVLDHSLIITGSMFDDPQDWYDMCIMSHCKHNIIANSSFSWWGAWLNSHKDKIVIMPEKWDHQRKTTELQWDGWYRIEC